MSEEWSLQLSDEGGSSSELSSELAFQIVATVLAALTMVITGLIVYSFCAFKARLTY